MCMCVCVYYFFKPNTHPFEPTLPKVKVIMLKVLRVMCVFLHLLPVMSPDDDYPDSYSASYAFVNSGKDTTVDTHQEVLALVFLDSPSTLSYFIQCFLHIKHLSSLHFSKL